MAITKKQIFKTAILPGIYPRLKNLFGSGFGQLAYLIALVYNTVRILPNNHPYLNQDHIGRYNIRQVVAEASNHIQFSTKNIDQILIFFTIIAALFILLIQFILLIMAIIIGSANAQATMPTSIAGFFVTPNPSEDLAYRLLDLVFGVPTFFGSRETVNTPVHQALHSLFEFYSFGMILVGSIIIIYFVIAVAAETAQSGIPFGQRFNKAWTVIRVVLFFGLLIPISNGLNGAQYITLSAAKAGSALASTGWITFNQVLISGSETLTGQPIQNIATPKPANLEHIPAFVLIAKTCQIAYNVNYNAVDFPNPNWDPTGANTGVKAWAVYLQNAAAGGNYRADLMSSETFQNISGRAASSDIYIVFGVNDPVAFPGNKAGIAPICGSLGLTITDLNDPGPALIHTSYYELVEELFNTDVDIARFAESYTRRGLNIAGYTNASAILPNQTDKLRFLTAVRTRSNNDVINAVQAQVAAGGWMMTPQMQDYGWAGAGIWYNYIAQKNGSLMAALHKTPITIEYPAAMEHVLSRNQQENRSAEYLERFGYVPTKGSPDLTITHAGQVEIVNTLNQVYQFWEGSEYQEQTKLTGNPFIDTINVILGTEGLFEMCANTETHPLAQLSAVGKSMVDRSIAAFAAAGIFTVGSILPNPFQGAADSMASFFGTVGSVGLLIGFILFYVLPFMPFLYFFFAVGGWVKGIFEAMVAMPLWALAHLRIDGDGIPGEAAIGGYYLIFEIFIRPILIVFGLVAAVTIFAAMVRVLNDIFYLAITNLSGHDAQSTTVCFTTPTQYSTTTPAIKQAELAQSYRGPIDEFFFTILYTIVVYMTGTSCFKLIDMIPNNILRWFNAEVPSFNDNAGDAAEGLMKYVTLGGSQFGSQIGQSLGGVGKGLQGTANSILKT